MIWKALTLINLYRLVVVSRHNINLLSIVSTKSTPRKSSPAPKSLRNFRKFQQNDFHRDRDQYHHYHQYYQHHHFTRLPRLSAPSPVGSLAFDPPLLKMSSLSEIVRQLPRLRLPRFLTPLPSIIILTAHSTFHHHHHWRWLSLLFVIIHCLASLDHNIFHLLHTTANDDDDD